MTSPQKIRCVVSEIIPHGDHVFTIELISERQLPRINAGQFLHLALDQYDPSGFWPDSRVFSIASFSHERERLRITYSVRGKFTARMEKELQQGKQVWIKVPYGDFVIQTNSPVALIAGGTGISAFTAFLENQLSVTTVPVTLYYGVRDRTLFIYRNLVENSLNKKANFKAYYFIEKLEQTFVNEIAGRIDLDEVWSRLTEPEQTNFYLSGPPGMLKAFSTLLQQKGLSLDLIHIDAWE
jgi:ferredoxin-NADP reductase